MVAADGGRVINDTTTNDTTEVAKMIATGIMPKTRPSTLPKSARQNSTSQTWFFWILTYIKRPVLIFWSRPPT